MGILILSPLQIKLSMKNKIFYFVVFLLIGSVHYTASGRNMGAAAGHEDSIFTKGNFLPREASPTRFNYLESAERLSNSIYLEDQGNQAVQSTIDSARATFSTISLRNRWIDNITNNVTMAAPFGMSRTIAPHNTTYQIAFANIRFTSAGAIARVFARCTPNGGTNGELYFAGNVNLSRVGGVGSNNTLSLIGNQSISYNNNTLVLKISGAPASDPSQFVFDCNGFTSLNIRAIVEIRASNYFPVDSTNFTRQNGAGINSAVFAVTLNKWEDLNKEGVSFPGLFGNARIPNYFFKINSAILDLTTLSNPTNADIARHIRENVTALPNTWVGLGITAMDVYLPAYFNVKNTTKRTRVPVTYGVVDEYGFSFRVSSKSPILNLSDKAGSANGWSFSINRFDLWYQKDAIITNSSSFSGKIVLPVEDQGFADRGVPFTAKYVQTDSRSGGEEFDVSVDESGFVTAKNFRGYLLFNSGDVELSFKVKQNKLMPKLVMSGQFGLSANRQGDMYQPSEQAKKAKEAKAEAKAAKKNKSFTPVDMAIDDIEFQELVMQTETAPFLQVKYLGAKAEMEIGSFGAQVAVELRTGFNSKGAADPNASCLHFDAALQFMEGKIGGAMGIDIYSRTNITAGSFDFEDIKFTSVNIAAKFSGVEFDGALDIMDNPSYGRGFSGQMILTVAKTLKVKAGAMFGTKYKSDGSSFSYFNIDGGADFKPAGVVVFGAVKITGFQGGVTYKMDVVKPSGNYPITVTGVSYVPNENSFLRLRAGVYMSVGDEKMLSGFGGLEFVFNQNWGLEEVSISGNAQIFSQMPNDDKTKISPLTQGRQQTYMSYKASQGEDVADSEESNGVSASRARRPGAGSGGTVGNSPGGELQIPDTISVIAQMRELKPRLDSAYNLMKRTENELNVTRATLAKNERIYAGMKHRSDSISNPARTSIAARFNSFFSPTASLGTYSYRSRNLDIWPEVARLLNIPETGFTTVRRANYTVPTQARIDKIKDSLTRVYANTAQSKSLRDYYDARRRICEKEQEAAQLAINMYQNLVKNETLRVRFGYQPFILANKPFNDARKQHWEGVKKNYRDSVNYYRAKGDEAHNLATQVIPIRAVFGDSSRLNDGIWRKNGNYNFTRNRNGQEVATLLTSYPLLDQAKILYDYYQIILIPKFRVEDSMTNLLTNVIKPLQIQEAGLKGKLQDQSNKHYNLAKTYNDTFVVVNNANQQVVRAFQLKVRKATGAKLNAADEAVIKNADAAYAKAKPIIDHWNYLNKVVALNNSLATSQKAVDNARNTLNSATATQQQKNAAQQSLNNLLVQYRADSAAVARRLLDENGGAIFSPSKLELYHVNRATKVAVQKDVIAKLLPLEAEVTRLKQATDALSKQYTSYAIDFTQYQNGLNGLIAPKELASKKVSDHFKNDFVRKLAYNLLNFPEESSAEVYRYQEIGLNKNIIDQSIDTAEAWLDAAVARINDSLRNPRNNPSFERQVVVPGGLRPDGNPQFWGDFLLKIDIKNSTVSLAMDVYTSIDIASIEVIRGAMDGNAKAGTLDLVVAGNKFDLNIGTESAPCSVGFSLGNFIKGSGSFYAQVNNRSSGGNVNASNFNMKFGMSGQVSWSGSAGLSGVVEAYASIYGGLSFSLNASRYDNFICSATNQKAGLEGWYGEGKMNVMVGAAAGVKILGYNIEVFRAEARAGLRARGPVPLFVTGNMQFSYGVRVLGINYSGRFDIGFTYGTSCAIPGLN